jgi:glucan phosphoethanolaminetransferase (alkaline phosphatase superfamily)
MDRTDATGFTRGSAAAADRQRALRLRALARWRRRMGFPVLLIPTAAVVLADVTRRGERLAGLERDHQLTYAVSLAESSLVWGALLYAASRRTGAARWLCAALFVVGFTFTFGGQSYFFEQYNAYLNVDVSLFASNFMDSVVNQLVADLSNYLVAKTPPALFALALVWLGRRALRPRRRAVSLVTWAAPALFVAGLFIPAQHRHLQASTPDVLYLHAVGGLIRTQLGWTEQSHQLRPRARQSLPVPTLTPARRPLRNVLFVILESVRADSVCVEFDPECRRTAHTNSALPERFPLTQMRSVTSSTAISLAVLWSGVGPHESREVLHSWPLIFDYARASGYETVFWTSQNMMFGNARLWVENLGVSDFVSATDLDPTADLDMGAPEVLLADYASAQLPRLKEPFLAVIQLSNGHYPYWVDPALPQPFQPADTSKAPEDTRVFKNYYQNAVYQQDLHVARILDTLRRTPAGARTVVVYTSDHAEAFREHNQMGHTFSVFDEEIKVPAWIAAPPGTLAQDEVENLAAKRHEFVFHVDVAPTILDLIGIWDDPALARYKGKMLGHSLLGRALTTAPVPLTNCAGVWSCAFENWGYMQRNLKLEARAWDPGWHCFDLSTDPHERRNLGEVACSTLKERALLTFGRLPGQDVPKPR